MPHLARGHEECRQLVCAICISERGDRAARKIKPAEEEQVKLLRPGYQACDAHFPSGICTRCSNLLLAKAAGKEVSFLLPEVPGVELPRGLRSKEGEVCSCHYCELGRLNGRHHSNCLRVL